MRTTGENVVAIVDGAAWRPTSPARAADAPTFFDIGGTVAVSYGTTLALDHLGAGAAAGVIAWVRVSGDAVRTNGVLRWMLTLAWSWLGGAVGGDRDDRRDLAAALRPRGLSPVVRAAGPAVPAADRRRRGGRLEDGARRTLAAGAAPIRPRHPALAWSVTLPLWIVLAAALSLVRAVGGLSVDRCRCSPPGVLLVVGAAAQRRRSFASRR